MADLSNNKTSNFPTLLAGLSGGQTLAGMLFPELFYGTTKFNVTNPASMVDKLTLSDSEISAIGRDSILTGSRMASKTASDIKQVGAATGNDAGTQTNLAELGTNIGKGVGETKGQLKEKQLNSYQNYYNLLNNYEMDKQAHDDANAKAKAAALQEGLGGFGKILALWQGGLL